MLKNISKLGTQLSKSEQREVSGGRLSKICNSGTPVIALCLDDNDCPPGAICCPHGNCMLVNPYGL